MTHVAHVGDMNNESYARLNLEYNFAGYPSLFYDGGHNVGVGAPVPPNDEYYYRDRIEESGTRVVPELDVLISIEHVIGTLYEVTVMVGNGVLANNLPLTPTSINGPVTSVLNAYNNFSVATTDPDAEQLLYQFDWGNGNMTDWIGPYNSGDSCTAEYAWASTGNYDVKARAKDSWGATSDWSSIHTVQVGCCVSDRGNFDGDIDDVIDISDLVGLVAFMFSGGVPSPCYEEADIDGSGEIDISDLVGLVAFMFSGGTAPASCF